MVIKSTRLGKLAVASEEIVKFPHGLPGFAGETAFAFVPYGPDSPFAFLQSSTDPNLTFLIVEPFAFFADYQFELDDELVRELGLADNPAFQVFNIVTVPDKIEEMTANLLAPVVINWKQRVAMQTVLEKAAYTTRHRLFPNGFPAKPAKGAE